MTRRELNRKNIFRFWIDFNNCRSVISYLNVTKFSSSFPVKCSMLFFNCYALEIGRMLSAWCIGELDSTGSMKGQWTCNWLWENIWDRILVRLLGCNLWTTTLKLSRFQQLVRMKPACCPSKCFALASASSRCWPIKLMWRLHHRLHAQTGNVIVPIKLIKIVNYLPLTNLSVITKFVIG